MQGWGKSGAFIVLFSLLGSPAVAAKSEAKADADAGGLPLHGRLFTDIYVPTKTPAYKRQYNEVSTNAWMLWEPKLDSHASAVINLEARHVAATSGTATSGFSIREGYALYSKSGFELRAGKQIIVWGKSDVFNPINFLEAKDGSRFNPDEEVKRIGAVGLLAGFTPASGNSPVTLQVVWNPKFAESKLLLAESMRPASITVANPRSPEGSVANSETAVRFIYQQASWDFSLAGYYGWNHLPELTRESLSATGQMVALPVYRRQKAVGADFSLTLDDYVFRFEGAHRWAERDRVDPMTKPSYFDIVTGFEQSLWSDFRLQFQVLYKRYPNWADPLSATASAPNANPGVEALDRVANQVLAVFNAQLQDYTQKDRLGSTFRLAYDDPAGNWQAEIFTLYYPRAHELLLQPKFTYAWTENFKTDIGTTQYRGSANSPLGNLKPLSSMFLEARYLF